MKIKTMLPKAVAALIILGILTACSDPKAVSGRNFKKVLQSYYDRPENTICINTAVGKTWSLDEVKIGTQAVRRSFIFSSWYSHPDDKSLQVVNALVAAGLLEKNGLTAKGQPVYLLTKIGQKALAADVMHGKRFCGGKFKVTQIENFTEPGNMMGMTVTAVHYKIKPVDLPVWMGNEELKAAYADILSSEERDIQSQLVLTNKGWVWAQEFR